MWGTILSLVLGGVPAIIRSLGQARVDLANAKTEQQRVAAQERIKGLELQRDVLIKESDSPWYYLAKFCLMAPFMFYFFWIIAYDKIICKWHTPGELIGAVCQTDPLTPEVFYIAMMIYSFYFLTDLTKFWKR